MKKLLFLLLVLTLPNTVNAAVYVPISYYSTDIGGWLGSRQCWLYSPDYNSPPSSMSAFDTAAAGYYYFDCSAVNTAHLSNAGRQIVAGTYTACATTNSTPPTVCGVSSMRVGCAKTTDSCNYCLAETSANEPNTFYDIWRCSDSDCITATRTKTTYSSKAGKCTPTVTTEFACGDGGFYVGGTGVNTTCYYCSGSGAVCPSTRGHLEPLKCKAGYYLDAQKTSCVLCPSNATCTQTNGHTDSFKCNTGYYKTSTGCHKCPSDGIEIVYQGSVDDGQILANPNMMAIESCYLTGWGIYIDETGKFTTQGDCYYVAPEV